MTMISSTGSIMRMSILSMERNVSRKIQSAAKVTDGMDM